MQEKSRQKDRKAPKKITQSYLYNSGLYYLQRYAASVAHFRTVMEQKIKRSCLYHNDDQITLYTSWLDPLVAEFCESGLLDDRAYTKAMTYSLRRRGMSKTFILKKLRVKGIPKELAEDILAQTDQDTLSDGQNSNADFEAALRFAKRKKIGPFSSALTTKSDDPEKLYKRALGQMARAGFSYDIAKNIISMSAKDIT